MPVVHDLRHGRCIRIEQDPGPCHFHGLSHLADRQLKVRADGLGDVKSNVGLFGDTEPSLLRRYCVDPDGEKCNRVSAGIVGHGLAGGVRLLIGDRDLNLRDHRPASVRDSASDLSCCRLSPQSARDAKQKGKRGAEQHKFSRCLHWLVSSFRRVL